MGNATHKTMGNFFIIFKILAREGDCYFDNLPQDLKIIIITYLGAKDVCTVSQLSKQWKVIANNEHM